MEGEEEGGMVKERVMVMMVREEMERERVRREVVKEVEKVEEDVVKMRQKKVEEGEEGEEEEEVGEIEKEEERLKGYERWTPRLVEVRVRTCVHTYCACFSTTPSFSPSLFLSLSVSS